MKKPTGKLIIAYTISFVFCAAYIAAAVIYKKISTETITAFVTFFAVIAVLLVLQAVRKKKEMVVTDEFTDLQNLKSFRNSWLCTLLAICVFSNLDYFGICSVPLNLALGDIMIVMVLSFWISHFFYLKNPGPR